MPSTFGEELAEHGWRTGSVVATKDVPAIENFLTRPGAGGPAVIEPHDWLIVVSQTCDLLARSLNAEPFVEILHCQPRDKLRPQHKELRSTRILDFKPNRDSNEGLVLSAHAVADRYLIPREALQHCTPDEARRLSEASTSRILAWYALRYGRPIWPDRFCERIRPSKNDLEKALAPMKDDIAEVRVGIDEKHKELGVSKNYHVAVYFVVDEIVWKTDVKARAAIHTSFATFVSVLAACDGIKVNQKLSEVVSGDKFTWQETRATDEWNFANLSHQD